MKLENAFSFWLDRTARMMKYFASTKALELNLDITIDQWVVLARAAELGRATQQELADKTFKDKASIARIAETLEKKGLIERHRNPDNRREYIVKTTLPGKSRVKELLPHIQTARSIGMQGFGDEEINTLIKMLQRIYHNYEKALNDEK